MLEHLGSNPYLDVVLTEKLSGDLQIYETLEKANHLLGLVRINTRNEPKFYSNSQLFRSS